MLTSTVKRMQISNKDPGMMLTSSNMSFANKRSTLQATGSKVKIGANNPVKMLATSRNAKMFTTYSNSPSRQHLLSPRQKEIQRKDKNAFLPEFLITKAPKPEVLASILKQSSSKVDLSEIH